MSRIGWLKLGASIFGVLTSCAVWMFVAIGLHYGPELPMSDYWPYLTAIAVAIASTLIALTVPRKRAPFRVYATMLLVLGCAWLTLGLFLTARDFGDALLYLPLAGLGACMIGLWQASRRMSAI